MGETFGEGLLKFSTGKSPVNSLAFNPDGKVLAVGQYFGDENSPTLSLVESNSGKIIQILEKSVNTKNSVYKVLFNKSGNKVVYHKQEKPDFTLVCYDLDTKEQKVLKKADRLEELYNFSFTPNGEHLVIPTVEKLEFWNIENYCIEKELEYESKKEINATECYITTAFSPDGKYVAIGGLKNKTVSLYDLEKNTVIKTFDTLFKYPGQIEIDPKGKYLAVMDFWQKGVYVWDLSNGERYLEKRFGDNLLKCKTIAFSNDGKYIALGYASSYVIIRNILTGKKVLRDKLHEGRVHDVCFSPDGKKILSASEDWQIIVRNVE